MKIILLSPDKKITVNTHGAYVEKFTYEDKMIFFPNVQIKIGEELKARGGMHPCIANFGKDNKTGEKQHGFGRYADWNVLENTRDYLKLGVNGIGNYEKVYFTIEYHLNDTFNTHLKIENKSNRLVPVAPGFHPYFFSSDNFVHVKDRKIDLSKIEDTIFLDRDSVEFFTSEGNFVVKGNRNISKYAIWSDKKGDYVCIEPTYNGNSFEDLYKKPKQLAPNEVFEMDFDIVVKEII
ncbi:MAG: aldose epimerase [Tissierellia bacterium]|nr:aldose epimerase [Tissierellia bacterium]